MSENDISLKKMNSIETKNTLDNEILIEKIDEKNIKKILGYNLKNFNFSEKEFQNSIEMKEKSVENIKAWDDERSQLIFFYEKIVQIIFIRLLDSNENIIKKVKNVIQFFKNTIQHHKKFSSIKIIDLSQIFKPKKENKKVFSETKKLYKII